MRDPRRWLWCFLLVFLSLAPAAAQTGPGEKALEIAHGFSTSDVAWRFGLIGALVLAPIPLLLRRRRRVLAAEGEARLNAWFDYWRAYRAIHLGGWLLWVAGFYTLRLDEWVAFAEGIRAGEFDHLA